MSYSGLPLLMSKIKKLETYTETPLDSSLVDRIDLKKMIVCSKIKKLENYTETPSDSSLVDRIDV